MDTHLTLMMVYYFLQLVCSWTGLAATVGAALSHHQPKTKDSIAAIAFSARHCWRTYGSSPGNHPPGGGSMTWVEQPGDISGLRPPGTPRRPQGPGSLEHRPVAVAARNRASWLARDPKERRVRVCQKILCQEYERSGWPSGQAYTLGI
eukprot:jgi/Mesvir1/25414/Mv24252-RA.1